MGWNATDFQLNLETKVLHIGRELMPPVLEDKGEGCRRRRVMEDTKHVIIVGECDDEVFWLEYFNLETVTQNVKAVCDPAMNIQQ
jgi:hypothetical protein